MSDEQTTAVESEATRRRGRRGQLADPAPDAEQVTPEEHPDKPAFGEPCSPPKDPPVDDFRRQAALAILTGWIHRHGGTSDVELDINMRTVWKMTDAFVQAEHAPPLPVQREVEPYNPFGRQVQSHTATTVGEWGVNDGGHLHKGFTTEVEAWEYAHQRPGATVFPVKSPELLSTNPNVE